VKLRSGFVSNSSSASFIITAFDGENQSVVDALIEQFEYSIFDIDAIIHNMNEEIKDLKLKIKESESAEDKHGFHKFWIEGYKRQIEDKQQIKDLVRDEQDFVKKELYKKNLSKILADKGIRYCVKDDAHVFEGDTTMYNDLNDMPELMFKILTALKFAGLKCNLSVESDN